MIRNPLFARHDWAQDPGVHLSGGAWRSLANCLNRNSWLVAEAVDRNPANSTFDCDLGAVRKVGVIHFQMLLTTTSGRMRVMAGTDPTFAVNAYDSGVISTWPQQVEPTIALLNWGNWSMSGTYDAEEYSSLGFPRYFIPDAIIDCQYVRVELFDETALRPPRVGYFGVCETWEMSASMDVGWSIGVMDGSDISRIDYGSSYVTPRAKPRRVYVGFNLLTQTDFYERAFRIIPKIGQSAPTLFIPYPDDTTNLERISIYGLLSEADCTAPNFATYAVALKIDQII